MDDVFVLPVNYRGKELEFEARLLLHGYIHRVEISINDFIVLFEPDEERNYRALVSIEQLESKENAPDKGLLQAIAEVLETLAAN